MLSLKINDIGLFTEMLFSKDVFDRFLLHDLNLTTSLSLTISGQKNPEFYDESEQAKELADPFVSWADVRSPIRTLISGRRLPVYFKIVLITSKKSTEALVRRSGFSDCEVSSLSMAILFRDRQLFLTTGVSYLGLSLDRSLEKTWETTVKSFLEDIKCGFEEI